MRFCTIVMLIILTHSAHAADLTVALPPGETSLLDVGMYRVGYQSVGGEVVWMPDSWVGHFEPVAGISYSPGSQVLGRPTLLLHSPWHIPPGKTFVDYRLKLPEVAPITLSFGIAMGLGQVAPGKSDGVTFSAYFTDKLQENELLREHVTSEAWKDFTFDLSLCAGETISIRLQVEPGPKNNPSFDFSYWGAPKIVCGAAGEARAQLLAQLTGAKAYQATAKSDLRALSNVPGQGVTPGNLLGGQTTLRPRGDGYELRYEGPDCTVAYLYEPKTGTLADFTCRVDGSAAFSPADGGGVIGEFPKKDGLYRLILTGGKALSVKPDGQALRVRWEYPLNDRKVAVDWTYGLTGKALTLSAQCAEPLLAGLSLGRVTQAPLRRMLPVPYLPSSGAPLCYLPGQNLYVCRYLDWTASHASACPQGEAIYNKKTDGTRNALLESGYVAVSPHVGEVLPNIPWTPSPYLKLLGPKIMLDIWGHHKGTYQGDAENLRELKDNGVDNLAIINHNWQRYGYDQKLPDHVPANPQYGGDEGMKEFGRAANECGYVWSLHENYIDMYPDAPSFDPSAIVLRPNGSRSLAWYHPGTKVQSFGLKCNRAKEFAEKNAPYIHKTYGTSAAYLDVHTCVSPWHQLDHEASQPMAAMALAKVKYDGELFDYMGQTHEGPLFGEGNRQFYWAGKCDGVEAQVDGGEDHAPFLDLDLLKIHPQMVNHGMGYYERWFRTARESRWGRNCGSVEQIDKYRAQSLAYGHAGFIGSMSTDNVQWVAKEHHLMHPLMALYGAAKPTRILYETGGKLVGASIALAVGDTRRQFIEYDSGLKLYVNWDPQPWSVGGKVIPQWGYLGTGPGVLSSTTLSNGRYADYAECPEYLFCDARTDMNLPYLKPAKDIEPKLGAFEYLGGDKIRLTYEWIVNDTFSDDQHCFVHFINGKTGEGDDIAFQGDHPLSKPTSQWQKGETVVDGPYEVTVPDKFDSYDIVIGLFKGPRVSLKGKNLGDQRILLGTLKLTKQDGMITNIALTDEALVKVDAETPIDIFSDRVNPAGTTIDFGKIITDGAVKINRSDNSLTLFPYPRDRQFTVSLDLQAICPQAKIDTAKVSVRALAEGTQADLGAVPVAWQKGRLVVQVGRAGAGRYIVAW
ncbi:MAG: DUF5696 domain-containing protein [Armatimonadota bacterium]